MFCPYCGKKIIKTYKYCPYCGKSISDVFKHETKNTKKTSGEKENKSFYESLLNYDKKLVDSFMKQLLDIDSSFSYENRKNVFEIFLPEDKKLVNYGYWLWFVFNNKRLVFKYKELPNRTFSSKEIKIKHSYDVDHAIEKFNQLYKNRFLKAERQISEKKKLPPLRSHNDLIIPGKYADDTNLPNASKQLSRKSNKDFE